MKKQFLKAIAFFSIITLVASCGKDSTGATYNQQISLKANGVLYSVTTGGTDVQESDAHIRDSNKFQLDATTSTKDFSINHKTVPGTGTYTLNSSSSVFDFAQWEDGSALYTSSTSKSHFTFTISNIAGNSSDYVRYIEGTFSGVLYNLTQTDSVIITNGQITILD
ncbi:MAG: hypothetical protein R2739_02980 [Chitinophagales bacterium]|nr:DUF5025 domain-containing protein [Bacteroidota bacterium]